MSSPQNTLGDNVPFPRWWDMMSVPSSLAGNKYIFYNTTYIIHLYTRNSNKSCFHSILWFLNPNSLRTGGKQPIFINENPTRNLDLPHFGHEWWTRAFGRFFEPRDLQKYHKTSSHWCYTARPGPRWLDFLIFEGMNLLVQPRRRNPC